MGQTIVKFVIHGASGAEEIEALVDTGATFTKVPPSVAKKIGLEGLYEADVELADGRTIKRKLALADVEVDEVKRPVLVAIAGSGERPLVGYKTLEMLGFKVNPVTHKHEKTALLNTR